MSYCGQKPQRQVFGGKNFFVIEGLIRVLSCQPRMRVMSCFVYKVIWDLESIDHLCINPIPRIGLMHR